MNPRLFSLLLIALVSLALPVMAAPERTISGVSGGGEEVVVSIDTGDIDTGGIVETLPEGFEFVSTTHPPGRLSVEGRQVSFVLIGDSAIHYRIRASGKGGGMITGVWEDFISSEGGAIEPTWVFVNGEGMVTVPSKDTTARAAAGPLLVPLAACGVVALLLRRDR
ncbi:hypothetical protein [Methanofollis fontis]|uniref:Uncharacterized protein n=1 Tax=Methanofollis fontis TaxID=2052832 RepID=A0A483CV23_9EURY|nr:hypothetical protein [Methanofollis fontis]TAJ45317.1 hypothetical protein CUJ86_00790 [Methanofollis fontis]